MDTKTIEKLKSSDIVAIDIETTDIDKSTCEILQISCVKNVYSSLTFYIKPEGKYEISEQAFQKHGLTKEFIEENGCYLKDVAKQIIDFIGNSGILVYNGINFDIPILCRHFNNIGFEFPYSNRHVYDAYLLECELNSHRLEDVYRRYFGHSLIDAHNAESDCIATIGVFEKQLEQLEDFELFAEEHNITTECAFPEGFMTSGTDGSIIFAVGKYKDRDFFDICNEDQQYIKWMWNKSGLLLESTKKRLKEYYKKKNSEKR